MGKPSNTLTQRPNAKDMFLKKFDFFADLQLRLKKKNLNKNKFLKAILPNQPYTKKLS